MSFEIDAFNLDLTPPSIAWGRPVWALLIIDQEATLVERDAIIAMSELKQVKKRSGIPEHVKDTYLTALSETSDYINWDDRHYCIGRVGDYDDLVGNISQIKATYDNLLIGCYRLLEGEQIEVFEKMAAVVTKFRTVQERLNDACETIRWCASTVDNLKPFVKAVEGCKPLNALQDGLVDEWIYMSHRFCEIFSALDLSNSPLKLAGTELYDYVPKLTAPLVPNESDRPNEEAILVQQDAELVDEASMQIPENITDVSVEKPTLPEGGADTSLYDN